MGSVDNFSRNRRWRPINHRGHSLWILRALEAKGMPAASGKFVPIIVAVNCKTQFCRSPRRGANFIFFENEKLNAVKSAASGNSLWVIFTY
jgi:hypothetical protein